MIITKEGYTRLAADMFSGDTKAVYINDVRAGAREQVILLERLKSGKEGLRGLVVRREGVYIVTA